MAMKDMSKLDLGHSLEPEIGKVLYQIHHEAEAVWTEYF